MQHITKRAGSVLFLVFCLEFVSSAGSEPACSWSYNDLRWDFSDLVRHRPQRDYKLQRGSWTFHFNPCSNTLRVPAACKHLQLAEAESPGFQTLSKDGEEACYLLGDSMLYNMLVVLIRFHLGSQLERGMNTCSKSSGS
jgi:hypothetical protein